MRVNHTPSHKSCLLSAGLIGLFLLFSSPASAGGARCFLHGIITPSLGNLEKPSISDMIRMHFDADNKDKCEKMLQAYCQYNVKEKLYSPTRLKGSFKADVEKTEEFSYTFDAKCKLLTEED